MVKNNKNKNKKRTVTKGQGAYFDSLKSKKGEITKIGRAMRYLGGLGGGAGAPMIGLDPGTGSAVGTKIAAAVSKWMGFGTYQVRVNSVLNPNSAIPMMHQQGQSIIVRHKEFIADVIGGAGTPSAYTIMQSIYLNPGLAASFPWLSSIAKQFQEYTWRGVIFHFISTSGQSVASTNTSLGTVMLHTDYRVTAPTPINKTELLNEYFASDAKPSECFVHPIECDPKENPYNVQYVRTGPVPVGEDPKSYDLGKVNVATVGLPSDSLNCGELWVTYEVELRKPQIIVDPPMVYAEGYTTINATNLFGTVRDIQANDLAVTLSNAGTIAFPLGTKGRYKVDLYYYGTTLTITFGASTLTNCTAVTNFAGADNATCDIATTTGWAHKTQILEFYPNLLAFYQFYCTTVINASRAYIFITPVSGQID